MRSTYWYYKVETNAKIINGNMKITLCNGKLEALQTLKSNFSDNVKIIKLVKTTMKKYNNGEY